MQEQWTDNFFLTDGNRTQNFRSTVAAGLALLMNLPNTRGSLSTSLAYSYDTASTDQQSNFFPSFTGTVQQTFSPRLSLTVSDSFRRDDDPLLADPNGVSRQRETFITNDFSASVNWLIDIFQTQFYYRNSIFLSDTDTTVSHILGGNVTAPVGALNTINVGYEFTYRPETDSDTSNTVENRVFASFTRQLGTFTSAGVSTSLSFISGSDNSRLGNISLFAAHGLPTGIAVSGSVGYSIFDSDSQSNLSHLFTCSLNVSYRFPQGAVISVGFFQDFRQTADTGQDFGIVATRSANGSFTYPITPFITGSLLVQYTRNEPVAGGGSTIPSETFFLAGANLNWQILTWLSLNLEYRYIDRQSDQKTNIGSGNTSASNFNNSSNLANQNFQNSTENRATLTLTASF